MNGQNRSDIRAGLQVDIVLKKDQPTGKLTRGTVKDILTNSRVIRMESKCVWQTDRLGVSNIS